MAASMSLENTPNLLKVNYGNSGQKLVKKLRKKRKKLYENVKED